MSVAWVALGSNLAEPAQQVRAALQALAALPDCRLLRHSSLYRTPPEGYLDQPDFINAVAALETTLPAHQLLTCLLRLEGEFGRQRSFRNAPRVLDLDLLLYQGLSLSGPGLTLPHPRMHLRAFVLLPLAELAPDLLLFAGRTVQDCLAGLDTGRIVRLTDTV